MDHNGLMNITASIQFFS